MSPPAPTPTFLAAYRTASAAATTFEAAVIEMHAVRADAQHGPGYREIVWQGVRAAWHRKQASGTTLRMALIERETLAMLVAA